MSSTQWRGSDLCRAARSQDRFNNDAVYRMADATGMKMDDPAWVRPGSSMPSKA